MQTVANDAAITLAAASGQLELNAFMPLIADALLDSLGLLCGAVSRFRSACIETLEADPAACARHLHASTAPALLLVPEIGYEAAAEIAKTSLATGKSIRQLAAEQGVLPAERLARLFPDA
jgi:aspartate ammonia-lyase